jgi:ligand-binding sensor domain-containing protein
MAARARNRWLLLSLLWLWTATGPVQALDPTWPFHHYVSRTWSVPEGLPSSAVTTLLQARDGDLWVGTTNGLARFDGDRFVVLDRRSSPALPATGIGALLEDSDGTLWIGTFGGGLVRLKEGRACRTRGHTGRCTPPGAGAYR